MAEVPNPGDFITLLTAPMFHVAGLGRMGQVVARLLQAGLCTHL